MPGGCSGPLHPWVLQPPLGLSGAGALRWQQCCPSTGENRHQLRSAPR